MPLIVEDGSGLATADSLVSVAEADLLQAGRNNATWFAMSLAEKEAKLREGSSYVSWNYEWKGSIAYAVQALAWPRIEVVDHEGRYIPSTLVPARVKEAVIILAGETGALQPATSAASVAAGELKRKRVGPLELEYFQGTSGSSATRSFPEVVMLLRGLIRGSPGGVNGHVERWS